jgi:hypothetical protein
MNLAGERQRLGSHQPDKTTSPIQTPWPYVHETALLPFESIPKDEPASPATADGEPFVWSERNDFELKLSRI